MTLSEATEYYLRAHWGTRRARPVVTHFYSPHNGWVAVSDRERLTPELATAYQHRGFVMLKARYRLRSVEVILTNYLGNRSSTSAAR